MNSEAEEGAPHPIARKSPLDQQSVILPSDPELLKSMVNELYSQRIELQTENERLRRGGHQVESAKRDFLAALSHELRIPLTPVMALLSSMEHDERLPGEARADIARMRGSLELESQVIDDLMVVSRFGENIQLRRNIVDMREIVRRAVEIVRHRVAEKRIELWVQLSAEHHQVCGDSRRLIQVIWNLLNNAIEFTSTGGDVTISSRNIGGAVQVRVMDSGIGIAPEEINQIFVSSPQEEQCIKCLGEIGLSLPISRKLVELHGGTLRAESAGPGEGSCFTVELPCYSLDIGTEAPAKPFTPAVSDGKLRILLVEDDAYTASTLERLLKNRGNYVEVGHSVVEAMALAGREKFDIVISDIGLPDGSGYDLMRYFVGRHDWKGIALSGYGTDADIEQSIRAGFSEHLIKPVPFEELEAAVGRVLSA